MVSLPLRGMGVKRGIGHGRPLEAHRSMLVRADGRTAARGAFRSQITAGVAHTYPAFDASQADLEDLYGLSARHTTINGRKHPFTYVN